MNQRVKVLVTGGAGRIAYSLVSQLCSGMAFGQNVHIDLVLFDLEAMEEKLKGVRMELEDCCFDILNSVTVTSKKEEAFNGIDYAILVGGFPRQPGMDRSGLMQKNLPIFKEQGEALDKYSKKSVRVLVVANPANLNAMVCMKFAPSIDKQNFMCLTALDGNRLHSQVKNSFSEIEKHELLEKQPQLCSRMTIFGDHSNTMVPFIDDRCPFKNLLSKDKEAEINKIVINRGASVLAVQGASSALSAAKAICDHLKAWHLGTEEGKWATLGVFFDKNPYQFEQKGLISSAPVHVDNNGNWRFADDIEIKEPERSLLNKSLEGLNQGWKEVEEIIKKL